MLIAWNSQAAAIRGASLQVGDLADINRQYTIAPCNALLNFIFYPFALVRVGTNQNDTDRGALQLLVNPVLYRGLALPFDRFKVCFIDKPGLRDSGDDVAIANVHCPMYVVIFEAEEDFPRHFGFLDLWKFG